MNEQVGIGILDSRFDRLSLNNTSPLSKSTPSNISSLSFNKSRNNGSSIPAVPPLPSSSSLATDKNSSNRPSNLSHVPCKFFKQGTCTAGANCIFSHNLDPTSESSVCKYFRKGNCKFGTKCALLHTLSPITAIQDNRGASSGSSNKVIQHQSSSPFNSNRCLFDQQQQQFYSTSVNSNNPFASSAPLQQPSPFSTMFLLDERLPATISSYNSNSSLQRPPPFMFQSNSTQTAISNKPLHSIPERQLRYYHEEQEEENDFMLPSSLNDLLTPNELRQQQYYPAAANSSMRSNNNNSFISNSLGTNHRFASSFNNNSVNNSSFNNESSSWNVPFYTSTANNTASTSSYSYDDSPPSTVLQQQQQIYQHHQQPINIPNGSGAIGTSTTNRNAFMDYNSQLYDYPANSLTIDEDGPFIMEDASLSIDPTTTTTKTKTNENYSSFNIIKHL